MEERRLPKNIRQIGDKEEKVRVYLEDYVYTFIRKLETGSGNRAGLLLGSREMTEGFECFYIHGAVELEGLIGKEGINFSEMTWKNAEEEIAAFFSNANICGWFVRGEDDNLPLDQLKQMHTKVFSEEHCLLYCRSDSYDGISMEDAGRVSDLKGFYIYFEKNFEMQNYMLSYQDSMLSETVDDQAAEHFRKIMKEKQKEKRTGQNIFAQMGTVAAAAVVFVGSVYLIGRAAAMGNSNQQIEAFAVGASVERQTGSGTGDSADSSILHSVTDRNAEEMEGQKTEALSAADALGAEPLEEEKEEEREETEEETVENPEPESSLEQYVKDGRQQEESIAEQTPAPILLPVNGSNMMNGYRYTIQAGDTLAGISLRFYGSTSMIAKICELNGITNPNTIFIGQEIELP